MQKEASAERTLQLLDIAKRRTPWGKLGTNFDPASNVSVPDAFNQAGLDWTVSKQPLKITHRGEVIVVPNRFALVNDANGDILDTVSNRYEPIQNHDLARYLDVARTWGPVETVGNIGANGRTAFVVFRGGEFDVTARGLQVGDTVRHYTAVRENKTLGSGLSISKYILRLACINGNIYPVADGIFSANLKHVKGVNNIMQYMAEAIAMMAEVDQQFKNSVNRLAAAEISDVEADYIFSQAIPMPKMGPDLLRLIKLDERRILDHEGKQLLNEASLKFQNKLEAAQIGRNTCREIYHGEVAQQGICGRAWGGLQAVIAYVDHPIVRRQKVHDHSAFTGYHAEMKVAAYKAALKFSQN